MTGGGRPDAVRRFLRRPWFWVGVVIVAAPTINWINQQSRTNPVPGPDSVRLQAVVERVDSGDVDLAYDNPITGQRVQTSAPQHGTVAAGEPVAITVDPVDPEHVRLAGDQPEADSGLVALAFLLALPAIWVAMRQWSIHAAEQLAARPSAPSFAMIGALAAPRRAGRRACLHLWPLDSPPEAEALCAIPVLVTAGLPIGVAFPVEVKGSPRSFGRVVARAGDTVLWPAARALRTTWLRRPTSVAGTPPWLPPVNAGPSPSRSAEPSAAFVAVQWPLVVGFLAAVALIGTVTVVTFVNQSRAQHLYRHGTDVVAEITKRGVTTVTVTYRLPGDPRPRAGQVPVSQPDEETMGLRLPAVVDPAQPQRLRFHRDRYDAGEPIAWAVIPFVGLGALLLTRLRTWRRSGEVAATTEWRTVTAQRRTRRWVTYLTISGEAGTVLEVRLPLESIWRLQECLDGRPLQLEMAGDTNPGSPVALCRNGLLLPATSPALCPRTQRPDVPPPPHGATWPAPRPGTGPAVP